MIRAHATAVVLTVQIRGPATMGESPAVQELALEHMARGMRWLRLDLRACTTIDSTFSGTMLWLKRQLDAVAGTLTLVSPSARVLELLRDMGLEDFYEIENSEREELSTSEGDWIEVAPTRPTLADLRRHLIGAHDELARGPSAAAREFGSVADALHDDHEHGRARVRGDELQQDSEGVTTSPGLSVPRLAGASRRATPVPQREAKHRS